MQTLYSPVRIDPFGGLSDLAEFRSKIGCNLVNIAIDIFDEDKNKRGICFEVTRIKDKSIEISVNGETIDLISNLDDIYNNKDSSLNESAKLFRSLVFNLYTRSSARNKLLQRDFFNEIPLGIKINVVNSIPVSSGLGTSGAFFAGCFEILYKYFVELDLIEFSKVYKEIGWKIVYESEVLLSGTKAGFQDQVAALYGGVNHLFSEPEIDQNEVKRDHQNTVGFSFFKYLEENSILIYTPRNKTSSDVLSEISKSSNLDQENFYKFLISIKKSQQAFYDFLISNKDNGKDTYIEFCKIVKKCWNKQYEILPNISSNIAKYLTECESSLLGFRECGAGGGGCSLLLFPVGSKEQDFKDLFKKCKSIQSNVQMFRFKANNTGIARIDKK